MSEKKAGITGKLVLVINGKGGVGKDAFCDAAGMFFKVRNVSAITPVKAIAAQCGWQGQKDLKSRKFLADLKRLLADYNGYPNTYLEGEYRAFVQSEDQILFVHIREEDQIRDFLDRIPGKKAALLIRSRRVEGATYGNAADDEAEAFPYDYVFDNNGTLAQLPDAVYAFLVGLLRQEGLEKAD